MAHSGDRNSFVLFRDYLRESPLSRALIRSREAELILTAGIEGRILDLGHGDGLFSEVLSRQGLRVVVGLDRNPEDLIRARKRHRQSGLRVHLVVGDMERLPFRDGAFSGAISNCVLEHVENLDRALIEGLRCLIPGGRFAVTVVTDLYEKLLFWPRFFDDYGFPRLSRTYLRKIREGFVHRRYPDYKEWISSAISAGFLVKDLKAYAGRRRQALMDLFLPFVPAGRVLRRLIGRETLLARRFPERLLHDWLEKDETERRVGASANIMMVLQRPI